LIDRPARNIQNALEYGATDQAAALSALRKDRLFGCGMIKQKV
jgi:hypothetical protein